MEHGSGKNSGTVRLIGTFKLLKGLLLVGIAFWLLRYLHRNAGDEAQRIARYLELDPANHFLQKILGKAGQLRSDQVPLFSGITFVYASLFLTEGVGLWLLKRWAEYFTAIVTASFIPLEIYELVRHVSILKLGILLLNAAIVVYLVIRLRKTAPSSHS